MAEGSIPAHLDVEATHLLSLGVSIGFNIYSEAASRQLGVPVDELRDRVRRVFESMLRALVAGASAAPDDCSSR